MGGQSPSLDTDLSLDPGPPEGAEPLSACGDGREPWAAPLGKSRPPHISAVCLEEEVGMVGGGKGPSWDEVRKPTLPSVLGRKGPRRPGVPVLHRHTGLSRPRGQCPHTAASPARVRGYVLTGSPSRCHLEAV